VASVETTFTAGTYSHIKVVMSDLSSISTAASVVVTLRNSTTAIVTLTTLSGGIMQHGTGHAVFTTGLNAATKQHVGHLVFGGVAASPDDVKSPRRLEDVWRNSGVGRKLSRPRPTR
jgi:hypothetical protein